MRVPRFLKKGVAIFATVSTLAIGLPAGAALAKCSNTGDTGVRIGSGVTVQQCDTNPDLTHWDANNPIVVIDDTGFHPSDITVGESPIDAHVIFVNLGTNTHSATQIPSSPMWNSTAFVTMKKNDFKQGGKGNTVFDTGGIGADPGVTPQQAIIDGSFMIGDFGTNGDYVFTSYPDCIAQDRVVPSPTKFDCTPATLHVVDFQGSLAVVKRDIGAGADYLGTSVKGTNLRPVGDPECAMLAPGNPILANGRNNSACVSAKTKSFAKSPKGSASKPLTNVTVTIDDIYGFDPDNFTVEVGTPITFVSKPTNIMTHDVVINNKRLVPGMVGSTASSNGGLASKTNSGALNPGDTWTISLNWVAVSTINLTSDTDADLVYHVNPVGNVGASNMFAAGVKTTCPEGLFTPVSFDQIRGAGRPCQSIAAAQDPAVLTPGTVKDF